MSLDWYIENVENYKEYCWIECSCSPPGENRNEHCRFCDKEKISLSPKTHTLIWAAMRIGMNSITEKNYKEFYARILLDPNSRREDGELFIQPEDVKAHIGLSTNVSSVSRTKWFKALMEETLRLVD